MFGLLDYCLDIYVVVSAVEGFSTDFLVYGLIRLHLAAKICLKLNYLRQYSYYLWWFMFGIVCNYINEYIHKFD